MIWGKRGVLRGLAVVLAVAVGWAPLASTPASAQSAPVLVFAAASLKNALDEIAAQWSKETGKQTKISYAASSALAKQIEGAAPADIFISADLDWMDYVAQRKLIKPESRVNLLGNRIVLVAGKDSKAATKIESGFALRTLLGDGRLAMANIDSVPAGKYGKAALEKLGVWSSVQDRLAQAENVRAALLLVSRGEAPLGIVYQTDAAADPNVKIVGVFPEDTHPAIVYPVAVTANSANPDAAAFAAYLGAPAARPLFEKQGFTVLSK
ncbi:molybdate ABC transporter substrate-binding protein [Reyranella sp. CPCC 100927]|uniref:molybdate ABC transporter substrate-binding protein n=1 Tax=Reyranella sp. CPCC 100927 TaxID=2599616 RepID=UPI0011B70353|nr:molybdate ABC transporter substrate-binding protein [Reyranella sp. CPCC 100927]